jgi:hypothetical protein
MFQLPAVVLSLIIASLCAALFFVWRGKTLRQLAVYWVVSLAGFFIGQWLAGALGLRLLVIGQVHIIEGIACAGGALFLVKFARM